ncbi:MAG: hypothetical protein R2848_03830 [Thermomicrobiales bacterium]
MRQLTDKYPVYLVNSVNPFRIEGQKTIVIEMLEQLNWEVPDVIVAGRQSGKHSCIRQGAIRSRQDRTNRSAPSSDDNSG